MQYLINKKIKIYYKFINSIKSEEYENAKLIFTGDYLLVDLDKRIERWHLKDIVSIEKIN